MVVSRNDIKRKRKDSDTTLDTLPESPKRTKVHAQRKFAQGSNVNSPAITPVKEIDREKAQKCNEAIQPTADLLPIKRPNTEDFLTFLCFRGTPILPPNLNFFNTATTISVQNENVSKSDTTKSAPTSTTTATTENADNPENNSERPFIAFGVRKRADPFTNNKLEKKRRHALALQALRRKYQEQRMAKIRAVTIEKMSEGIKIKSKNLVRTRSVARREVDPAPKRKIKVVTTKRVKITRSPIKRPMLKQKMCLRSRGRLIARELSSPIKKRPVKIKKIKPPKKESSSEFSSDDDQPLVKTIKKPNKILLKPLPKVAKKSAQGPKKPASLIRLTRSSQSSDQLENNVSQRPPRKTKEAATLYMELLGRKLVNEAEVDDDDASIDSFPELPNVRRTEQREIEMKAKAKIQTKSKITTRKSSALAKEKTDKPKVVEKTNIKPKSVQQNKKSSQQSDTSNVVEKSVEQRKVALRSRNEKPIKTETKTGIKTEKQIKTEPQSEQVIKTEPTFDTQSEKSVKSEPKSNTPSEKSIKIEPKIITHTEKSEQNNSKDNEKSKTDQTFNDSDEEPLVKLTIQKKSVVKQTNKKSAPTPTDTTKKNNIPIKKEPIISLSDDDEEKAFRGFVKTEDTKTKPTISEIEKVPEIELPIQTSADLLCKDVGRRFGKGKVNMSTEQIEKWLKDSALAGECNKKDDEDLGIKFEEKDECKPKTKGKPVEKTSNTQPKSKKQEDKKIENIKQIKSKLEQNTTTPKSGKNQISNERKYTFQPRRTILNKERKEISPNTKAFSPDNESSVYAFEADFETPINTPFRSNVRRPSSTASRSEDDATRDEDRKKLDDSKFRLPNIVKPAQIKSNKQELSLTLSADDSHNASIAVHVNIDSSESNVSMECSTQTDVGDEDTDGHLFYIPLQPGSKQTLTNQQVIQGVAVKLGTESSAGSNPRVVMRAKLVTQHPEKISAQGKQLNSSLMYPPAYHRPKPGLDANKSSFKHSAIECNSNKSLGEMVPSSPSASSSSSAKIYKRAVKPRARNLDMCVPVNATEFPSANGPAQLVEAPTFHPSEKEFQDPLEFIEKIRPHAEKFGICRIIPPANFKPECKVSDDMRFTAYNQYVHKMLHRWGPNFKELMAIRKYLATQSINFTHPPWIGGMEIDLPRLYQTVQTLGGLKEVIEKKRWPKVAEGMKIPKSAQDRVTKLDDIYCKYLLPYDTLSPAEREKLFDEVETEWAKRESRSYPSTTAPCSPTPSSSSSQSSSSDNEENECTIKGRNMALNSFYRIARNTMSMWFKNTEPTAQEVEQEFWRHVTTKQCHICVHSGSIDSGGWGYGFACGKNSPFARHPWNLKILTNNCQSVLRSMGPVMGVTVPTLHVGMVFSACCWYRDPHGLPWIEYLHTGANKIWYGIPDSFSSIFHSALTKIVPSYCRNKTLWLTSDTAMVPPSLLVKNGVSLCRTVQEPGQFIVVFPKAFTSSVCSGYVVSESVYFAPCNWLLTAQQAFKDIRDSCEPSMFSLERLLLSISSDTRTSSDVLMQILPVIEELRDKENLGRIKLESLGLKTLERLPLPDNLNARKKRKLQEEDGDYECEICRTNLYVSLVIDSHEEGVYCLDHALDHIKGKADQLKYCKLLFTYNIQDLDNLIERMRLNIETKSHHVKKPAKFSSKATLLK